MSVLEKLASFHNTASALGERSFVETVKDGSMTGKHKLGTMAKMAGVRLARGAWNASGANDIPILNAAKNALSNHLETKKKREEEEEEKKKKYSYKQKEAKGFDYSNKRQKEPKPESKSKELIRDRVKQNEDNVKQRQLLKGQQQSTALTDKIAEDVHFIASTIKRSASPLRPNPFGLMGGAGAAGAGGGLSLIDMFAGASTLKMGGGLIGKGVGAAKNLGAKVIGKGAGLLGKGAGLLSKVPGLGKVGALAGATGYLSSKFGGKEGAEIVGKEALSLVPKEPLSLVPKAGEEVAKTAEKAVGAEAAKSVEKVGSEALAKTAGKEAVEQGGKAAGKSLLKKIPLLGLAMGLGFGAERAWKGDWTGAGLEVLSGAASTVPGFGTAASIATDAGLAYRDISGASAEAEKTESKPISDRIFGAFDSAKSWLGLGEPDKEPPKEIKLAENRKHDDPILPKADKGFEPKPTPTPIPALAPIAQSQSEFLKPANFDTEQTSPSQVYDLLDTFLQVALDPDKGIYVRKADDTFSRNEDLLSSLRTPDQVFESERVNAVRDNFQPSSSNIRVPSVGATINEGSGFAPNSERPHSPRSGIDGVTSPQRVDARALGHGGDGAARAKPTNSLFPQAKSSFNGFGEDVDNHIAEASQKYGIDEKVLRGFVKMEGGWKGAMSPTGAIGTGQFIQSTWDGLAKTQEGQEIGMTKIGNRFRTENDPRFDKRTNTLATGLLAKQNARMLEKAGIEPSGENLYMMHNIGPGVIDVLRGKQASSSTITAMKQNGMKDGMTPQDFVEFQKKRYQSHYEQANAITPNKGEKKAVKGNTNTDSDSDKKSIAEPLKVSNDRISSERLTNVSKNASERHENKTIVIQQPAQSSSNKQAGTAQGDTRPDISVRNNESSIRRVSDSTISKTMT